MRLTIWSSGIFALMVFPAALAAQEPASASTFDKPTSDKPTFYKEVLPIFQQRCQICHRAGEIGTMPLVDYEGARPWAKAIKAAVTARKMPPWFADPQFGHFRDERRLSDAEIRTIVEWVDAGAPEGDIKDKPAPLPWPEGWNIRADEVFQMPTPYVVPAKDATNYVYVVIPTGFKRDTWVTAAEIRPGARSVVHHALAVVRPPGSTWMKDAKPFVPYLPPMQTHDGAAPDASGDANGEAAPNANDPLADPAGTMYELLTAYAPGAGAQRFDTDHSAKLIPAGSDIVLQLHYTANGKTEVPDQTRVAIEIVKEAPPKRFMSAVLNAWKWEIPPGDPNYEGHGRLTFGEPVELVFIQPHMHYRGKDMTIRVIYPSGGAEAGKTETLLSISRYDFNWQVIYYLRDPLQLPAGTKVEVTAHWDNSANNPWNPDPTKTVRWGNQSWDEMLSVPMGVIIDR
jgi:mono/diheme cytochrome c family protein